MTARIRIIKHEAMPDCGSFEVRYADGRPSRFWYWDDIPGRRLRPEMTHEAALEAAKAFARAEPDRTADKSGGDFRDHSRPETVFLIC